MLDSTTQTLENQLFLTISGSNTVFLFDYAELPCNEAELLQLIKQTCKITNRHQYNLNGAILNEAYLLSLLDDATSITSTNKSLADRNNTIYRQLCSLVRDLGDRVIVIKHAHQLSKPAVQLISRLAKYAKKTGSNWKFFLLLNGEPLDAISLRLLSIEQFFPESPSISTPRVAPPARSGGEHGSTESDASLVTKRERLKAGSAIVMTVMACLVLWSIFQSPTDEQSGELVSDDIDVLKASREVDAPTVVEGLSSSMSSTAYLNDTQFQKKLVDITRVSAVVGEGENREQFSNEQVSSTVVAEEARLVRDLVPMSAAFWSALQSSNVAKVASLVLEGESLESVNERGETALIYAINSNDSHLLKSLLAMKADVNFVDAYGRSALFYACIEGRSSIIKALLKAGANTNLRSLQLKTPLMAATHNGNESAALILLQNGADIDAQDEAGWTALFHSAWNDNLGMSRLLVHQGSEPSLVDGNGYTAAQIAEFRGSGNVYTYLNSLSVSDGGG